MQFNILDDTKTSDLPVWVPPSPSHESRFSGSQNQKSLGIQCSVTGQTAAVGPSHLKRSERRILCAITWSIEDIKNVHSVSPIPAIIRQTQALEESLQSRKRDHKISPQEHCEAVPNISLSI